MPCFRLMMSDTLNGKYLTVPFQISGQEQVFYELAQVFLRHFRAAFFDCEPTLG